MENPALEREDAADDGEAPSRAPGTDLPSSAPGADPQAADVDWSDDPSSGWGGPGEEEGDRNFGTPDLPTLRDHLVAQLSLVNISARDRAFVGLLIDALDEDGYLTQPLEEIAALLPSEALVDLDELAIALRHLQNLEPAGVGARSPGECLSLQLQILPEGKETPGPVRRLAIDITEKHLELLANRDYTRLRALTGADDEALRAAQRLIQALNPYPGSAFARIEARYVIPDVIVKKSRNVWRARLNPDAMPKLRINRLYAELAAGSRSGGAGVSSQLQEARWLIKNVQQRFDTILRVSQAIVDRQRQFLEHGEVAMRPLVLREIAETLGLHESTISRVTTQKFMSTPRGTLELKYFFGSHVATDAGGAASSTAIRALIKQLVAAEDAKAPLSDSRIAQILGEQGIVVARRTIAKYRESLHIPPVNQRKAL